MDRIAIARAERRRQMAEELELEQDRAAALHDEIVRIVLELEATGVDEAVFAQMPPEDVDLVRAAPADGSGAEGEDGVWSDAGDDVFGAEGDDEPSAAELREEQEAEIRRLREEIAASTRRQEALQRYLDTLDRIGAAPRTREQLESAWAEADPAPRGAGTVELICVRGTDGHSTPDRVRVTVEQGVDGDRWSTGAKRDPDAQVTLMNVRVTRLIAHDGVSLDAPGDNFQVDLDVSEESLPVGTRLRLGETVLEVSPAPHTGCKKFRERFGLDALKWVNDLGHLRLRGVNCRVVESGTVAVGDPVVVVAS